MSHPYKTRSGGATVTIFVPYDCRNHCPFCINKRNMPTAPGFSVEAILRSIAVMDAITPGVRLRFHPAVSPSPSWATCSGCST